MSWESREDIEEVPGDFRQREDRCRLWNRGTRGLAMAPLRGTVV